MSYCPSEEILRSLDIDALDGATYAAIEAHVEGCPKCLAVLERHAKASAVFAASPHVRDQWLALDGFTIEKKLGEGATSAVYLAQSDMLGRQVAIKVLPGGQRATSRERSQWLREARAASRVRHPHVVTLHEVREADDCFLLIMEYMPGGTLGDRITEPAAPRAAASIAEIIALAVGHIHQSGVFHLDLKPSNILLDGDATEGWDTLIPKVSDFGIARSSDANATDTGSVGPGGTPSYMAPEQITKPRKELTAQADIHGIGAILYQMLTGRPPYQGATVLETIDQVQRLEPVLPRRFRASIPRDLETICLKCLQKNPARRYASAEALADDLRRWLEGRPITARPVSTAERAWRWCRRRPAAAALAAALVLTLLVSFATVVVFWRQAEAHLRLSTEMAGDLVDLVVGGEDSYPRAMGSDQIISVLEKQRARLGALTVSRPNDPSISHSLTLVEYSLARSLTQASRHEDARALLLQALQKADNLVRRYPRVRGAWNIRVKCCHGLAQLSEGRGESDAGITYQRRAIEAREDGLRHEVLSARDIAELVRERIELAWLLDDRGDHDQARALIAASRRSLENPSAGRDDPYLNAGRLLCDVDRYEMRFGQPLETKSKASLHHAGGFLASSCLASPKDSARSAEDWARLVTESLRCDHYDPRVAGRRETESAFWFADSVWSLASRSRRSNDLVGAKRIAERLFALAKRVVDAHPSEPAAYLALSLAYAQIYKNAYESHDDSEIEPNMKRARDAALKALSLEPTSELTRHQVDDLERRLSALSKGR